MEIVITLMNLFSIVQEKSLMQSGMGISGSSGVVTLVSVVIVNFIVGTPLTFKKEELIHSF
jgi:hypothetical protein